MKKYYIVFDEYERGIIINALNDKRNALIKEGRYTDAVDEVLLKVINILKTTINRDIIKYIFLTCEVKNYGSHKQMVLTQRSL